jgi:hypothetical protein
MAVVTLTVREAIKRAGAAYERGQLDQAALISNLDGLAAAGLSGADARPRLGRSRRCYQAPQ